MVPAFRLGEEVDNQEVNKGKQVQVSLVRCPSNEKRRGSDAGVIGIKQSCSGISFLF